MQLGHVERRFGLTHLGRQGFDPGTAVHENDAGQGDALLEDALQLADLACVAVDLLNDVFDVGVYGVHGSYLHKHKGLTPPFDDVLYVARHCS